MNRHLICYGVSFLTMAQPEQNNVYNNNLLSVNPNLLSFADRVYNRYRDLYNEKTLYGQKGRTNSSQIYYLSYVVKMFGKLEK